MISLDFENFVEKSVKYTRENRDTLHYKGNMKSVIYLFCFESYLVTCRTKYGII